MNDIRHWAELRCDYLDEDDQFWRVDAWKTSNDDEEGEVIAYIDDNTGRVLYNEPLARVDTYAQELIQSKVKGINERNKTTAHTTIRDVAGDVSSGTYRVGFFNTAEQRADETEFEVVNLRDLEILFDDFCRENHIANDRVLYVENREDNAINADMVTEILLAYLKQDIRAHGAAHVRKVLLEECYCDPRAIVALGLDKLVF